MHRAICRCGQELATPADPTERVVCPKCGARVRIRVHAHIRSGAKAESPTADGYIRFFCPCGRRLKVDGVTPPPSGKCPDCGRIVPVPATSLASSRPSGHPEAPTEDLAPVDLARLDRWAAAHLGRPTEPEAPPADRAEVGLRVCPQCGSLVPLGSQSCRSCGTPVPRR